MGVILADIAQDDFKARLDRIRDRTGQTVMMVGQDEQYVIPRKVFAQTTRAGEVATNLMYPASLLGAILLGMLAVAISQYVRFQLMAGPDALTDPMTEALMVGGLGLVASFVLSQAFKLTSKEHRSLQGAGVFLMVCTFHNLSHWLPGPMSVIFSPAYVQLTVATSQPNTFRISGGNSAIAEAAQSAPDTAQTAAPEVHLPILRKGGKIVSGG